MVDISDKASKLRGEVIKGKTPGEIVCEGGLLQRLTARLYKRALEGEMTHQLGHPPKARLGKNTADSPNGQTSKTVKPDTFDMYIAILHDRHGEINPQAAKKHQRRSSRFDEKVLALYAGGVTTRGIMEHLWRNIIPFFACPPEIRKMGYTMNAIELMPARGLTKWGLSIKNWAAALNHFSIMFEGRI